MELFLIGFSASVLANIFFYASIHLYKHMRRKKRKNNPAFLKTVQYQSGPECHPFL